MYGSPDSNCQESLLETADTAAGTAAMIDYARMARVVDGVANALR